MGRIDIDFKPLIVALIIISGALGWAIVEVVFWLFSFIDITFK
tara:strand:+ start:829 stop:957 length:129 start_codon:yes stop_codon:yes gene_type:complete